MYLYDEVPVLKSAYLMTADYAEAMNGKIYIHGGGWDQILVTSGFPFTRQISIALGIDVPWEDPPSEHPFRVHIREDRSNAGELMNAEGALRAGGRVNLAPGAIQTLHVALTGNVGFEHAGRYIVRVEVDGAEIAQRGFSVVTP